MCSCASGGRSRWLAAQRHEGQAGCRLPHRRAGRTAAVGPHRRGRAATAGRPRVRGTGPAARDPPARGWWPGRARHLREGGRLAHRRGTDGRRESSRPSAAAVGAGSGGDGESTASREEGRKFSRSGGAAGTRGRCGASRPPPPQTRPSPSVRGGRGKIFWYRGRRCNFWEQESLNAKSRRQRCFCSRRIAIGRAARFRLTWKRGCARISSRFICLDVR